MWTIHIQSRGLGRNPNCNLEWPARKKLNHDQYTWWSSRNSAVSPVNWIRALSNPVETYAILQHGENSMETLCRRQVNLLVLDLCHWQVQMGLGSLGIHCARWEYKYNDSSGYHLLSWHILRNLIQESMILCTLMADAGPCTVRMWAAISYTAPCVCIEISSRWRFKSVCWQIIERVRNKGDWQLQAGRRLE